MMPSDVILSEGLTADHWRFQPGTTFFSTREKKTVNNELQSEQLEVHSCLLDFL